MPVFPKCTDEHVGMQNATESHNVLTLGQEGRTFVFNNTRNTFYLRLYSIGHMVKDCSDRE